ncbi:hypothetical protein [Streptomyces aureus]|uniref:hypothetical protein n=1 Tax=Streptomyces aureus TaxID=193461 RepID=UPI0006E3AC65|nr:hypothetical protein [Streptomyces aureus]
MEDLYSLQHYRRALETVECDPLTRSDALHDVQLLEARVGPTVNQAALLFDMRTASFFPSGNAALIVFRGLRSLRWDGMPQDSKLMAFTVTSSRPRVAPTGEISFEMDFFPDGNLAVSGDCADFYLLQVEGIPEAPPLYLERSLEHVRSDLPSWDSQCEVLQSSTLPQAIG